MGKGERVRSTARIARLAARLSGTRRRIMTISSCLEFCGTAGTTHGSNWLSVGQTHRSRLQVQVRII